MREEGEFAGEGGVEAFGVGAREDAEVAGDVGFEGTGERRAVGVLALEGHGAGGGDGRGGVAGAEGQRAGVFGDEAD